MSFHYLKCKRNSVITYLRTSTQFLLILRNKGSYQNMRRYPVMTCAKWLVLICQNNICTYISEPLKLSYMLYTIAIYPFKWWRAFKELKSRHWMELGPLRNSDPATGWIHKAHIYKFDRKVCELTFSKLIIVKGTLAVHFF